MSVSNLKRWHWIAIAVVVGLACGAVRQGNGPELSVDDYDHLFTTTAKFEHAVTGVTHGQHMLHDIIVYPYPMPSKNGSNPQMYLVTGQYWDGNSRAQDGVLVPNYQTACYLAASPYIPSTATGTGPGNAGFPTVLDYLKSLQPSGVTFRYAWWWPLTAPISMWLIGSLILIGGIWPTVINLIAFGTFTRPTEQKPASLKDVQGTASAKSGTGPEIDPGLIQKLEQEIEAGLAASVPEPPIEPTIPQAQAPVLAEAPPEPATALTEDQHKEFAAKRDDFYPTERRVHKEDVEDK